MEACSVLSLVGGRCWWNACGLKMQQPVNNSPETSDVSLSKADNKSSPLARAMAAMAASAQVCTVTGCALQPFCNATPYTSKATSPAPHREDQWLLKHSQANERWEQQWGQLYSQRLTTSWQQSPIQLGQWCVMYTSDITRQLNLKVHCLLSTHTQALVEAQKHKCFSSVTVDSPGNNNGNKINCVTHTHTHNAANSLQLNKGHYHPWQALEMSHAVHLSDCLTTTTTTCNTPVQTRCSKQIRDTITITTPEDVRHAVHASHQPACEPSAWLASAEEHLLST